jgi:hypothetical protein
MGKNAEKWIYSPTCTCPRCQNSRVYENRQPEYTHRYRIAYWLEDGCYSLWCCEHPSVSPSDNDTHHLQANNWICVRAGRDPRNFETAEALAWHWMLSFSEFAYRGKFDNGGRRINMPDR